MPYKDKGQYLQYQQAYGRKNKQRLSSYYKGWRLSHKEAKRLYDLVYRKTLKARFSDYRVSAKRRNIPFLIDVVEFEKYWKQPCYYCKNIPETIGIDRINSSEGYSLGNIIPCCKQCNQMKLNYSQEDFVAKCIQISKNFT